MVGVSLPFAWCGEDAVLSELIPVLKGNGVRSVELRTVRLGYDPETVLQAAQRLWKEGFLITVHGSVLSQATAVEDVYGPLEKLLAALRQDELNITIHPIVGDNCAVLRALSDYALKNGYPVTIALENNRLLPDKTQGDSAALVLSAVEAADRSNVGICFDMGHYAYYWEKNHPDEPMRLPGTDFWKRVIHTHIHDIVSLRTHFPLGTGTLPLAQYLQALSFGYFGVYNLELDFPRIQPEWSPVAALERSLPYLNSRLHHCAKLYDDVREHFDGWFYGALKCWETEDNAFGLIHSSAYLFYTAGCKWGMDIAFRNARYLAKTPARAAELLKDMQVLVLSHGHRDHYEEETLKALSGNDTLFVIPDFLEERTRALGIAPEKLVIARPGEEICLFGVTFKPFVSKHFRPGGSGVPEYGYRVTAPGCPQLVFPVDIRDFSGNTEVTPAAYCFANLWLGDNSIEGWKESVGPWAACMSSFAQKKIFITHLYEDGRTDDKIWNNTHAFAAAEALHRLRPDLVVSIPERGQVIRLE